MSLLNRFSFLVFSTTPPEPAHLLGLPMANPYGPCAASVILAPGETTKVLVPFAVSPNLSSPAVDLVNTTGTTVVLASIGTTTSHLPVGNVGAVVIGECDLTLPTTGLPKSGYYRLRLTGVNGPIYSNRIWLLNADYESLSARFSFRNTRPVGPIDYTIPTLAVFRNLLRLKCQTGQPQTETEVEVYEEITTGIKVDVQNRTHVSIPFSTPRTDALGHEGWRTMLAHRDLTINDKAVSLKTGYSIGDPAGALASGSFEVWESTYSIVNRC